MAQGGGADIIMRFARKRVTIEVPLVNGGTRKTSVTSESLHPVKA